MYDRLFTRAWFYDRCIEGSLTIPDAAGVILLGIAIFLLLLSSLFISSKISLLRYLSIALLSVLLVPCGIIIFSILNLFIQDRLFTVPYPPMLAFSGLLAGASTLCIVGIVVFFLYQMFLVRKYKVFMIIHIILTLLVTVTTTFSIYLLIVFIACSEPLEGIEAGHRIHAVMKAWHDNGRGWPKDVHELRITEEKTFDDLVHHTKIVYLADPSSDSFTLFIRPSKYKVIVFDTATDFRTYSLGPPEEVRAGIWQWPPEYPGPWDKLPQ